ncbi:MAG: MraY family glycosyltransferase [Candidatus Oxydemutatoraceae bacterium WSBS_2016_MAG_OTU14]
MDINQTLIFQVVLIISAFVLTVMATASLGHYLFHRQAFDIPNERSSHIVATPRGGGLSIVLVFLTLSTLVAIDAGMLKTWSVVLLSGIAIALLGMFDDRKHLPPSVRMVVHFAVVTACLMVFGVPPVPFFGNTLETWLLYPLAAIAWVWCINFFNFMDGIDGIASTQAIAMSLFAALIIFLFTQNQGTWIAYLVLLASASAGFLVWNWSPAKIFMGDSASGFLGYILGLFAVLTAVQGVMNVWSWLILFGAFAVDATVTLIVRFLRREVCYEAHRQHVYQRLSMLLQKIEGILLCPQRVRAKAHQAVNIVFIAINLFWLLPLAILASWDVFYAPLYAMIALLPLVLVAVAIQVKRIGE